MWRLVLAGLLCASCDQIFGLQQTHQLATDSGGPDACGTAPGCPCTESSQCASAVCVVSAAAASGSGGGACADANDVAYVASPPMGSLTIDTCTQSVPCSAVSTALRTTRTVISVAGVIDENVSITHSADIYGTTSDAALEDQGSSGLAVVTVPPVSTVTLHDLAIENATVGARGSGFGVVLVGDGDLTLIHCSITLNQGTGVFAGSGGTVSVLRSSIAVNHGGGLDLDSKVVTLANDFIVNNGAMGGAVGGVAVEGDVAQLTFEYDTVCSNTSVTNSPAHTGGRVLRAEADAAQEQHRRGQPRLRRDRRLGASGTGRPWLPVGGDLCRLGRRPVRLPEHERLPHRVVERGAR